MPPQKKAGTCVTCGVIVEPESIFKIKGKIYCPNCAALIEQKEKKEKSDYSKLMDYLYKLCDEDKDILGFLVKQVKNLKSMEGCDYKDSDILATLKYVFELSEHPPVFNPTYGIEPLVVRNYYWARKYYEAKRKLEKQDVKVIDNILQAPEVEVHIDKDIMEYQRQLFLEKHKDKLYGPAIDLDSIEDEEEIDEQ